jgi:hypothetical protein
MSTGRKHLECIESKVIEMQVLHTIILEIIASIPSLQQEYNAAAPHHRLQG